MKLFLEYPNCFAFFVAYFAAERKITQAFRDLLHLSHRIP